MPGSANWYGYEIDSDKFKASFSVQQPGGSVPSTFPEHPSTIHAFLTFLEKHGQVQITVPNYSVTRNQTASEDKEGWSYNFTAEKSCVFKITQRFPKSKKARHDNIGAMLNHTAVKSSAHVQALIKMQCRSKGFYLSESAAGAVQGVRRMACKQRHDT